MGQTIIVFSPGQMAAALWRYGEDSLASRALDVKESELPSLWEWAGDHWYEDSGLPLRTRLVSDKVIAFAGMHYFERRLRPLSQERRRPEKQMPEAIREAPPLSEEAQLLGLTWEGSGAHGRPSLRDRLRGGRRRARRSR